MILFVSQVQIVSVSAVTPGIFSLTIRRIWRAITVTCASASALQLWLKFCMEGFFSQTTDAIALKLPTLIGHHQMTLQDKSQNSISDFDIIMSLFYLEILVKVLRATTLRVHILVTT